MGGYENPCRDPECALEGRHEAHPPAPPPRAGIVLITRRHPSRLYPTEVLATTNRNYGQYSLPGGKVEESDPSPRFTARRELREETTLVALDSDLTFLLSAWNDLNGSRRQIHVFFARHAWGKPTDVEEGTSHAWFTFEKLLDSSIFAPFYRAHFPDGVDHLVPTVLASS